MRLSLLPPCLVLGSFGAFEAPAPMCAEGQADMTVVNSQVSDDYVRARQPDGSFQPETYAFGEGGLWGGGVHDDSIDKTKFLDVAHVIASPLADRNYLPTKDAKETKLLIMVYWGLTDPPPPVSQSVAYENFSIAQGVLSEALNEAKAGGSSAVVDAAMDQVSAANLQLNIENRLRDRTDLQNARILGYDSEGLIGTELGASLRGTALGFRRDDLVAEVEDHRYFVVLMAYDFQLMWRQKKHKLLWETRFSIREQHHEFDKDLYAMAKDASAYFGQASHGIVRQPIPEGRVHVGEAKSLGSEAEK